MASDTPIIVIELVLVAGGALAFGWWQLWDLKKERIKREAREREAQLKISSKASPD